MNELKVTQNLGSISFNFEELKTEIQRVADDYATTVYTDEKIIEAKEDRAKLNKLKTALNDERKRREKEFLAPFQLFKDNVNELITIIDRPVALIDEQIKEYEAQKKQAKAAEIKAYFAGVEKPDFLKIEQIWSDKWLNATASMKSVCGEIDDKVKTIVSEIATIESLPNFAFEALEEYKRTLNMSAAIAEGQRLADIQRRKEEAERAKAEAEAARIEAEKAKAEAEAARLEAEKAKAEQAAQTTANEEPEMPFVSEPAEEFIPNFDSTAKAVVTMPANKVKTIGEWLEANGCTVEFI